MSLMSRIESVCIAKYQEFRRDFVGIVRLNVVKCRCTEMVLH